MKFCYQGFAACISIESVGGPILSNGLWFDSSQRHEHEPDLPAHLLMTSFERPVMRRRPSSCIFLHKTHSSVQDQHMLPEVDNRVIDDGCG